MVRKYRVSTLGCKVNQYESQRVRAVLAECGLTPAGSSDVPDLVVVNTCAVTSTAAAKSRQAIRREARGGETTVVVIGCDAVAEADRLRQIAGVQAVLGHDVDVAACLRRLLADSSRVSRPVPDAPSQWNADPSTESPTAGRNDVWMMPGAPNRTHQGKQDSPPVQPSHFALPIIESLSGSVKPMSGSVGSIGQAGADSVDPELEGCADSVESEAEGCAEWTAGRRPVRGALPAADFVCSDERQVGAASGEDAPALVEASPELTERIDHFDGQQRAFLKVQDGCDAYCTYCIIPQLRTQVRSKPLELAVEETRALVAAGHREVVVTGIYLGAFGRETAIRRRFEPGIQPLAQLVGRLAGVAGLERLRLSSLEPGDVGPELLDVLAVHPNCVPHLHLPLQSGSERILKLMGRQYTLGQFRRMIQQVHAALDRPAITTDIIVGFPGETEEDFAASLDLAREVGFLKIHAFPFSLREGTPAARKQARFVPKAVMRERMARLAEVERENSRAFRRSLIGRRERIIVEQVLDPCGGSNAAAQAPCLFGRTDRYFEVHACASPPKHAGAGSGGRPCVGSLVDVVLIDADDERTEAHWLDSMPDAC
jgi:MiaB/RimO family radical SAM methylthiotransferase